MVQLIQIKLHRPLRMRLGLQPDQVLRNNAWVLSASFSPDAARVVTASADQTAAIWSAAGGEKIFTLTHNDVSWSPSFSPGAVYIGTLFTFVLCVCVSAFTG